MPHALEQQRVGRLVSERLLSEYAWYAGNTWNVGEKHAQPVGMKQLTPGVCTICAATSGNIVRTNMEIRPKRIDGSTGTF